MNFEKPSIDPVLSRYRVFRSLEMFGLKFPEGNLEQLILAETLEISF
ncbi:hypothetical protein CKA32_003592 [Geitlerinema sp. FC II]|nr:hypothetical protein CKA32_003592 [Geitlerinema sp. FC II]